MPIRAAVGPPRKIVLAILSLNNLTQFADLTSADLMGGP